MMYALMKYVRKQRQRNPVFITNHDSLRLMWLTVAVHLCCKMCRFHVYTLLNCDDDDDYA